MSSYQNHRVENAIPKLFSYYHFDPGPILETLKLIKTDWSGEIFAYGYHFCSGFNQLVFCVVVKYI